MPKCAIIECRSEAYHHIAGGVDKFCVLHHLEYWKQRKTMRQLLHNCSCEIHKEYYLPLIEKLGVLMFQ